MVLRRIERTREFDELPFASPDLQAVNHEEDARYEFRTVCSVLASCNTGLWRPLGVLLQTRTRGDTHLIASPLDDHASSSATPASALGIDSRKFRCHSSNASSRQMRPE